MNTAIELMMDLARMEDMIWVVGGRAVVSENNSVGMKEPEIENGYISLEATNWHCHIAVDEVTNAQFVLAQAHPDLVSYYVRFSQGYDKTLIRCYFPNPRLDGNHNRVDFQQDKLDIFEDKKNIYVNDDDIVFVDRT